MTTITHDPLRRSRHNNVVAGVCGGLAEFFNTRTLSLSLGRAKNIAASVAAITTRKIIHNIPCGRVFRVRSIESDLSLSAFMQQRRELSRTPRKRQ